ncbi:broad-complex core protein-like isoform X2 [Venturia canescens]|uniref:broad-complex core protein-like isoform X2 n=1 Tax=Venturia canescens TaxID=32260 RepID=UPI001C9D0C51|nr:broad-complex core protein-like isoform X2 [Venturia canescens]
MVDTQHFCLRWNNYQSSITSAFENLRDDEDFVDVTLACDGKSLKAHRVVLSACSPYFRELLKSTPCKHPVIVLQDVAFSDLHALVEFIYHGEVNVHQRSLSSFLKTAEVLRVSGLTQQADQTERDELSHVRALAARTNHLPPHDKLADEGFPRGGSPPTPATPTPTSVQHMLRRGQIRRNEMRSPDSHDETTKRIRVHSPPLNNNDATPTDFSMVKNHLSSKVEGNGLHDENSRIADDNIKCEPLELTGGNGGAAANNEDSSDSGAAASDRPPASASSNEHDHEPEHPSTPNYLPESKLFTSTPGSFNFSMAALTTDHTPLSGLGHGLQTPDLAGTSQDREVAEEDGGWRSAITSDRVCHEGNRRIERSSGEDDDVDDGDDDEEEEEEEEEDEDDDDNDDDDDDDDDGPQGNDNDEDEHKNEAVREHDNDEASKSRYRGTADASIFATTSDERERHSDRLGSMMTDQQHEDLPIIDLLDEINKQIAFKSEPASPKCNVVDDFESCFVLDDTDDDYDVGNSHGNGDYRQRNKNRNVAKQTTASAENHSSTRKLEHTSDALKPRVKLRGMSRRPVAETERKYAAHLRTSGSTTYCRFCQKTFSRAWSLQRHLADTHFYVPQSLACDQCGRSYKSRNSLVSHKSQYHARKDRKDHEAHCELTY